MDEEKLQLLLEAEKRGILSSDKIELLNEARNRNLIPQLKKVDGVEQFQDISTTESIARGVNVGVLAKLPGAAVDIVNNLPSLTVATTKFLFPTAYNILPKKVKEYINKKSDTTITSAASQALGIEDVKPLGGAKSIKKGLSKIGIGYEDIKDIPQEKRPFAVAGETIGESIIPAALPFKAAAKVKDIKKIEGLFSPVIRGAAQRPLAFAGTEALTSTAAGTGAGLAEIIAPGDPTARTVGELVGGTAAALSPGLNLPTILREGRRLYRSVKPGQEGLQREAAEIIQREVTDPQKTLKRLEQIPISKSLTSGQITGDPGLLAIENTLIKESNQVKGDIGARIKKSFKDFNDEYKKIVQTGDPQEIRKASQNRLEIINSYLNNKINNAVKSVDDLSANAFATDKNKETINLEARKVIDSSLKDANTTEKQLWGKINNNLPVNITNFKKALRDVIDNKADEEIINPRIIQRSKSLEDKDFLTLGNLQKSRSFYLDEARKATANNDFNNARKYKLLAQEILQDFNSIKPQNEIDKINYDNARDYTKLKNELFRKPAVAKILGRRPSGEKVIREEQTLSSLTVPKDNGKYSLKELRKAAELDITIGEETFKSPKRYNEMELLQNDMLRILAGETVNYRGGINLKNLENFVKQFEPSLRDAGLYDKFSNINEARRIAENVSKVANKKTKAFNAKSFTSQVVNGNIDNIINRVINTSNNPTADITSLAAITRNKGRQGLQYSIMQNLLENSSLSKNNETIISGIKLNSILNKITETGESLGDVLVRTNLISKQQKNSLDALIEKSNVFENALNNTEMIDNLIGKESPIYDLLLRIAGSNIGAAGAVGQVSGSPLVAAQAGSRAAKTLLNQMPRAKVQQILIEAMKNPNLMKILLTKPTNINRRLLTNQINAYLIAAGIPELKE